MKFTVGRKIGLGFGVVGLLMLAVFTTTINIVDSAQDTLKTSIASNKKYVEVLGPTVGNLEHIAQDLSSVKVNINNWVYNTTNDTEPLEDLNKSIDTLLPSHINDLTEIIKDWDKSETKGIETFEKIKENMNVLYSQVDNVRDILPDYAAKSEDVFLFMAQNAVQDEINPLIKNIQTDVKYLLEKKTEEANLERQLMSSQFKETDNRFNLLFTIIIIALIVLAVGTLIIALVTTKSITGPVHKLREILLNLGKGIFPKEKINPSNDEIGEMSLAMNNLVDGLKETTNFANEVGKSNFEYPYNPLSDEDVLGHALVKMRDELSESERILEQKVKDRTAEVVAQKEEIEGQNEKLEELYQDVTASIRYAKRLQDSILPTDNSILKMLPESFVLFKPKDIVSGDFYWFAETEDKFLFSSVDCTGHGVPGAFMSLIGANALNQIVRNDINEPAKILDELNKLSSEALNKSEEGRDKVRDGMDMSLCSISKDFKQLEYAGANNPMYFIRDGELSITKADKHAIASFEYGEFNYTNHDVELKKGDLVYLFSDGYADQFGGAKGKKFMYKKFRDLLMEIKDLPMPEQKRILDAKIEDWKGDIEQVDDILVIGVRIA